MRFLVLICGILSLIFLIFKTSSLVQLETSEFDRNTNILNLGNLDVTFFKRDYESIEDEAMLYDLFEEEEDDYSITLNTIHIILERLLKKENSFEDMIQKIKSFHTTLSENNHMKVEFLINAIAINIHNIINERIQYISKDKNSSTITNICSDAIIRTIRIIEISSKFHPKTPFLNYHMLLSLFLIEAHVSSGKLLNPITNDYIMFHEELRKDLLVLKKLKNKTAIQLMISIELILNNDFKKLDIDDPMLKKQYKLAKESCRSFHNHRETLDEYLQFNSVDKIKVYLQELFKENGFNKQRIRNEKEKMRVTENKIVLNAPVIIILLMYLSVAFFLLFLTFP